MFSWHTVYPYAIYLHCIFLASLHVKIAREAFLSATLRTDVAVAATNAVTLQGVSDIFVVIHNNSILCLKTSCPNLTEFVSNCLMLPQIENGTNLRQSSLNTA